MPNFLWSKYSYQLLILTKTIRVILHSYSISFSGHLHFSKNLSTCFPVASFCIVSLRARPRPPPSSLLSPLTFLQTNWPLSCLPWLHILKYYFFQLNLFQDDFKESILVLPICLSILLLFNNYTCIPLAYSLQSDICNFQKTN